VQSDWHQAGREQGYNNPKEQALAQEKIRALKAEHKRLGQVKELESSPLERSIISQQRFDLMNQVNELSKVGKSGIPDAPFKDTWYQLALKRAIKEAVDKGYDRIGLTTGAQQAERYDLSKQISRVVYSPETEMLNAFDNSNRSVFQQSGIKPDQIENYIGKEPAKKLFEQQNTKLYRRGGKDVSYQEINGVDLQVGGEGMKKYYDEIYPNFLNKYGKKYGAQVGETRIKTGRGVQGGEKVRYLDITPEMKKAVQKGQPLAAVEGMTGLLA
jgi:hypothetical protein